MSRRGAGFASLMLGHVLAAFLCLANAGASPAKEVLDNGLVVITSPSESSSVVVIEMLVKASALHEPVGKAGLRQLVQQTMVRGSEHMSGNDLAAALDDIGADFDTGLGLDYVEVYMVSLARDFGRAVELMAEVVRCPVFPAAEVEREREVAARHLESLAAAPFDSVQLLARQGLYAGHPYGLPPQGTMKSLASITRADLADFHGRHYVPNNTIIAIAGGVPRAEAAAGARRCFGDWRRRPLPPVDAPPVRPLERSTLQVREGAVGQAYFMLAYDVGELRPDAYPVMEVMRALLGRGMGSRFFGAVRDRAAVAYEADCYHFALVQGGYIGAYVATEPRDLERTKQLIVGEFERLRAEPVTAAELRRAQQFAIGTDALEHQKAKDRAFHLAWYEAIGLGYDFDQRYPQAIGSVTAEQVRAAARSLFGCYSLGLMLPGG